MKICPPCGGQTDEDSQRVRSRCTALDSVHPQTRHSTGRFLLTSPIIFVFNQVFYSLPVHLKERVQTNTKSCRRFLLCFPTVLQPHLRTCSPDSCIRALCPLPSHVETLVVLQVPQVGEALPTLVTHELFLTRVDLLMGLQAVSLIEAAAACVAGEGFLPGVDPLVSVQVPRVAETFAARVTPEGFLSGVDHLTRRFKERQS